MNDIEINEMEWYFRDFMFRNYNAGVLQFDMEHIASNMVKTYLRYRNAEPGHIASILKIVLENLISCKFLEPRDKFVRLGDGISRLQCGKCYYTCYLGNLEERLCLRCKSNELRTFPKKVDLY
jgi:hypothetical protein